MIAAAFWLASLWGTYYLADFLAKLRRDLMDEAAARWTDDQLKRAISQALAELSYHIPRFKKSTIATTVNSRSVDISSLSDRIGVDAVEYPIGQDPPSLRYFSVFGDTLTIKEPLDEYQTDTVPNGGNCYVYWHQLHTLSASESSISNVQENLLLVGASAYACQSISQLRTDQSGIGGDQADRDYRMWGDDRMKDFRMGLKKVTIRKRPRVGKFSV